MSFNIEVEGGTSVRLPTAGKYCDRDIVITAKGGGGEVNTGTCTIVIDVPSKTTYYIGRETVSSGAVGFNMSRSYTDAEIKVTTRCDSIMYIMASSVKGAECTGGEILKMQSGQGVVFKTPSTAGASVQLTLSA